MENPLQNILPSAVRQKLYGIYALLGLVLAAAQAGIGAAGLGQPTWMKVVLAVFAVLGTVFGVTAFSNTGPGRATSPTLTSGGSVDTTSTPVGSSPVR
jgi:hypothetical protein